MRTDSKEFQTKAEYNRWLVRQENAKSAEETRTQAKAGEEIIKERQRRHTTQGLSRQQAAMVQMKKASESLEAHREQNLTHGRKVYEEVNGWRTGAKATKDAWATYGKGIKETQRENNATAASLKQMSDVKKAKAAATRADDLVKEQERANLKQAREKEVKEQAAKVREQTADDVTDTAKRVFYEQRLATAKATKEEEAARAKERSEKSAAFKVVQNQRRLKSKGVRESASKSREALLTERAAAASKLREGKRSLAEEHKQRMQADYLNKANIVKGVIANMIYHEGEPTGASPPGAALGSPKGSPKPLRSPSARSPGPGTPGVEAA